MLSRRAANETRALLELVELQEHAARKAGRTARSARNALGKVRHAAKRASQRMQAEVAVGRAAGLKTAERDGAAAQLLDLAREVAALGRELAVCSSDLPWSGAGRGYVAATGCAATTSRGWKAGRRRTTGSATSAREDDLRARLRALLAHARSMRARIGRRPAVFRRLTFRSRHTALAREFYKPTAVPCSEAGGNGEKLAHNVEGFRGLLAQLKAISGRRLVRLSAVDGGSNTCAALRAEGDAVRRARG